MNNLQNIIEWYKSSSHLSQEILLDLLQDFLSPTLQAHKSSPETIAILDVFWKEIIWFSEIFSQIQQIYSNYLIRIIPNQKNISSYSDNLQKILTYISLQEIQYIRRTWINILAKNNFVKNLEKERYFQEIFLEDKKKAQLEQDFEIIEWRFEKFKTEFWEKFFTNLDIFFLAFKRSEIENLLKNLRKPQKIIVFFDKKESTLYINEVGILFQQSSLFAKFLWEFVDNPNKELFYYDILQKYDDRNISEKIANKKWSTIITKINKKIEEKMNLKDFFSRWKGCFYRKNTE